MKFSPFYFPKKNTNTKKCVGIAESGVVNSTFHVVFAMNIYDMSVHTTVRAPPRTLPLYIATRFRTVCCDRSVIFEDNFTCLSFLVLEEEKEW